MATSVAPHKFRDFDRMMAKGNFFVTIIGSVLAFVLAYFSETFIIFSELPEPANVEFPPYGISFSFAMIIIVAIYTRNMASSLMVGISAGLGITSPSGEDVRFVQAYIAICIIFAVSLGLLADRLRLVLNWVRYYILSAFIFTLILLGFSYTSARNGVDDYKTINVDIGGSENFGLGDTLPFYEIIGLGTVVFLLLITLIVTRGQIILDRNSSKKYVRIGNLLILLGHVATLGVLYLLTTSLDQIQMEQVARRPYFLGTLGDLFSKSDPGFYSIVEEPYNIFVIISIIFTVTNMGLAFRTIGINKGNIEGMKGKSDVSYLAVPWGLVILLIGASFQASEYIYGGGFFVSEELMVPFTIMAWAMLYINFLVAKIILWFLDKLSSN